MGLDDDLNSRIHGGPVEEHSLVGESTLDFKKKKKNQAQAQQGAKQDDMNAAAVKSVAHVFSIVKRQKAQVVRLSAQVGQNHDAQVQQGAEHDEQDAVLKQLGSEVARPSEEIVSLKRTSTPNSDAPQAASHARHEEHEADRTRLGSNRARGMFQMTQKPNIPKGVLGSRQTCRDIQLCVHLVHTAATAAPLSACLTRYQKSFVYGHDGHDRWKYSFACVSSPAVAHLRDAIHSVVWWFVLLPRCTRRAGAFGFHTLSDPGRWMPLWAALAVDAVDG